MPGAGTITITPFDVLCMEPSEGVALVPWSGVLIKFSEFVFCS